MEEAVKTVSLLGPTYKLTTGCGTIYVTICETEEKPFWIFAHIGKAGGCASANVEALCRLSALALQEGASPERVIQQLKGISCHQSNGSIISCPHAIGAALERFELSRGKDKTESKQSGD